ncbi:M30 family zinc metallopeptidase [Cupriavidus pampae]|uniref:Uncharacterized protein n=1 Tax=Cupriavidus pampae TaxID=659251 RepID=A0ABM8XZ89_9BURK|nr:hypothetical protein [Cupriavidus pampae]CAG9185769.1 hypothetical protein LMG32289_06098 [Cupriavidus pampae]
MQSFYRRAVVKGLTYASDTWLEEGAAMMMEDFASQSTDSTYNAIRDIRGRACAYLARNVVIGYSLCSYCVSDASTLHRKVPASALH